MNTVLITGSSTGIGKATAQLFIEKGWNVIATMRAPEKEQELANSERVLVTKLDVQDLRSIETAVSDGLAKFGKIDVVVNNAGYGLTGPVESIPREKIQRQFAVNVFGLLDVTKAVLPHFRKQKSGMFINISSIGGRVTFPLFSLYHGTKFAVEGISESMSYELAAIGCKMKIVEPGGVATDFGGRSLDVSFNEGPSEYAPVAQKMMAFFQSRSAPSQAIDVARVIYTAATDGSDQLRYPAGPDAIESLANRKKLNDADYMGGLKNMMGL